jgi:hypothetical protein
MGPQRKGVPQPSANTQKAEKDAYERKLKRRNSDRGAVAGLASLAFISAPALERKTDTRVGGEPFASAVTEGLTSADDSSSTATRSSCVSRHSAKESEHAMNFANSFIQFVKERQLL